MSNTIISSMVLMVIVILVLVAILLIIKAAITPKAVSYTHLTLPTKA